MPARLLLIEDDPSIASFVALALEEPPPDGLGVEITVVRHLAAAREALQAGGWQLVISDLMLPDGSAESLLGEGLAQAAGAPPWLVFSAGLQEDRRAGLLALGVRRLLRKPVPLAELLDTVAGLLAASPIAAAPRASTAAPPPGADPVAEHFGGDRSLFESFRAGCIERFAADLADGDRACASGDAPALQRVAHGLKAVLVLLGQPALAGHARALEDAAAPGAAAPAWQRLAADWAVLAEGLVALGARRPPG